MKEKPGAVLSSVREADEIFIFENIDAGKEPTPDQTTFRVPTHLNSSQHKSLSMLASALILLKNTLSLGKKKGALSENSQKLLLDMNKGPHFLGVPCVSVARSPEKINRRPLVSLYRKTVTVYREIENASIQQYNLPFLSLLDEQLSSIIDGLSELTKVYDLQVKEVLDYLTFANNKLNLIITLFSVEEIDPLYRLIIRNKVLPSFKNLIHEALLSWMSLLAGDTYINAPPPPKQEPKPPPSPPKSEPHPSEKKPPKKSK